MFGKLCDGSSRSGCTVWTNHEMHLFIYFDAKEPKMRHNQAILDARSRGTKSVVGGKKQKEMKEP